VSRALKLYVILLVAIFVIEWGSAYFHQYVLHAEYPYTSTLFNRDIRYSDWTNFTLRVSHYGEPGMQVRKDLGLPYPYPLPSLYIFLIFIRVFSHSLEAYRIFTILEFAVVTAWFSLYLRRISASLLAEGSVWLTVLLGAPALIAYDRANIEVFLWLFVLLGVISYLRNWKYAAAILFALAASMKIYPALFFLLFLPRRQYKAFALGIIATATFSLAALAAVGPTISTALHDMSGSAQYLRHYQIVALASNNLRYDHSLLALEKQTFNKLLNLRAAHYHLPAPEPTFERSVKIYSIVAPIAFLAIYFLRVRRMPLLNQFAALTILSVILPYVSYDYTLIHVYIVFAVFLVVIIQEGRGQSLARHYERIAAMMACFAVIFAPWAFLARERYAGQFKCLALIGLLVLILATPIPSKLFGDGSVEIAPGS
jgi:hypothetical protein